MNKKRDLMNEVNYILKVVKELVENNKYILINRYKNNLALIGYTVELFEYTIQELTYKNYIEGPNFNNKHVNNVWIFGYDDNEQKIQIYIKFGIDKEEKRTCFISFHQAEYKLRYFGWR